MAKKLKPLKCQPGIWRKFSPCEQRVWSEMNEVYLDLLQEEVISGGIFPGHTLAVTAHNLACEHVWGMQRFFDLPNHKGRREKFYKSL